MTKLVTVPSISVVLPVRNGGRFVHAAVASILHQDNVAHEVIVVDDGSTDQTVGQLGAIDDARLRVVRTPPRGLVAALNTGIAEARAPVIARMDADDIAVPHRLATQLAALDRADFVFAAADLIDTEGRPIGRNECPPLSRDERRAALLGERRAPPLIHPTAMMRRDVLLALGGYRDSPSSEDHELWLRAIDRVRFAAVAAPLLRYRVNPDGISRRKAAEQSVSNLVNCVAYRLAVARGVDLMSDRPHLHARLRAETERQQAPLFARLAAARLARSALRRRSIGALGTALAGLPIASLPLLGLGAQRRALLAAQAALLVTTQTWLDADG